MEEKTQMKSQSLSLFSKYLSAQRIHPSLILVSPEEEMPKVAALQLAKTHFCKNPPATFCKGCSSCQRIDKGIYPDLIWLSSQDEEPLKVENIREIIYQMEVAPLEGIGKVCVIEKAHEMNAACANALLKTIEEPKPGRHFVLLTSQLGNLIPTLLSRSLVFHFKPHSQAGAFSEAEWGDWESLFSQYQETQDPDLFLDSCKEKDKALRLLQFLQTATYKKICENQGPAFLSRFTDKDCDKKYQKLLELESKLRSNANFGLLFQGFLTEEFHS